MENPLAGLAWRFTMCAPTLDYAEGQVQAESTARTRVFSGWTLLYGATSLMTTVGLEAIETNVGAQVTWRAATVLPSVPGSWQSPYPTTAAGAYATNNSLNPHTFDVSTAAMFVQAAVARSSPPARPRRKASSSCGRGSTPRASWSRGSG